MQVQLVKQVQELMMERQRLLLLEEIQVILSFGAQAQVIKLFPIYRQEVIPLRLLITICARPKK